MYNTGRASYCFAACQDCVAELEREAPKENLVATLRCFLRRNLWLIHVESAGMRGEEEEEEEGGGGISS